MRERGREKGREREKKKEKRREREIERDEVYRISILENENTRYLD